LCDLAKTVVSNMRSVGSKHLDVADDPKRSRVGNTIMDGVRLRDAPRYHAKGPIHQSNNLSEFPVSN